MEAANVGMKFGMYHPKVIVYNEKNDNGRYDVKYVIGRVTYSKEYRKPIIKNLCPLIDDIEWSPDNLLSIVTECNDRKKAESAIDKMNKITSEDFHIYTEANYTTCECPEREYDFISPSGSKYWIYEDYVIRKSDHWGTVASCKWYLDGESPIINSYEPELCGIVKYKDMKRRVMGAGKLIAIEHEY